MGLREVEEHRGRLGHRHGNQADLIQENIMYDDHLSPGRVGWLALRAFEYGLGKGSYPTSMVPGHGVQVISGHGVQVRAYAAANATGFRTDHALAGVRTN